jgi:hypothetical protein
MLSLIFKKAVEVVLWCCTLFWMFFSVGELLEGGPIGKHQMEGDNSIISLAFNPKK